MAIICHVPSKVEIGRVVVGVKIFKCWKFTFVWSPKMFCVEFG